MAQIDIDTIKKIDKEHYSVHEKVVTTYSVFEVDGKKYIQFDTYGKSSREIPGKISQSMQLDKESAICIVDMLRREFHI
jgi:hypothetical protein